MNKLSALALALLSAGAMAQVTCQNIGTLTTCSDGTSYNRIGNMTFGSDGSSANRIGNQTFINPGYQPPPPIYQPPVYQAPQVNTFPPAMLQPQPRCFRNAWGQVQCF